MSRRGYAFERDTELWCCKILSKDPHADFMTRPFRTASSGAILSCKGDIRSPEVSWLESLTFEAKHITDNLKRGGKAFHLYVDWVHKLKAEAAITKSVPVFTWAFKRAKGAGRVQMAVPLVNFDEWSRRACVGYVTAPDGVVHYNGKRRKHFLIYHDELWEHAKLGGATVFPFVLLPDGEKWVVISRPQLEHMLLALRDEWKIKNPERDPDALMRAEIDILKERGEH